VGPCVPTPDGSLYRTLSLGRVRPARRRERQPRHRGAIEDLEAVLEKPAINYCFIALNDAMQELGQERSD